MGDQGRDVNPYQAPEALIGPPSAELPTNDKAAPGDSFIELLVVSAIIAVLNALLLPSIGYSGYSTSQRNLIVLICFLSILVAVVTVARFCMRGLPRVLTRWRDRRASDPDL